MFSKDRSCCRFLPCLLWNDYGYYIGLFKVFAFANSKT